MHSKLILNLLVPTGIIRIVVFDANDFFLAVLSPENYHRITIKPKLWVAFKGLAIINMLVNIASYRHASV